MADDDEDLRTRVEVVEHEVARLRDQVGIVAADAAAARTLAAGADRDGAELRAELRGHTRTLNALRETQVEHGNAILGLRGEVAELRSEMRGGLAELRSEMRGGLAELRSEMNGGLAEVRSEMHGGLAEVRSEMHGGLAEVRSEMHGGFATLRTGMEHITTLLTQVIERGE